MPLCTSSFLYRRCASRRCSGRIGPVSPQSSITSRASLILRVGETERLVNTISFQRRACLSCLVQGKKKRVNCQWITIQQRLLTFLNHLADKDLAESSNNKCHRLCHLLVQNRSHQLLKHKSKRAHGVSASRLFCISKTYKHAT